MQRTFKEGAGTISCSAPRKQLRHCGSVTKLATEIALLWEKKTCCAPRPSDALLPRIGYPGEGPGFGCGLGTSC